MCVRARAFVCVVCVCVWFHLVLLVNYLRVYYKDAPRKVTTMIIYHSSFFSR